MATFLRGFVEAIAPGREIPSPVHKVKESKRPKTTKSGGGLRPRRPRIEQGQCSQTALERSAMDHEVEVEELGSDIKEDQQVQRNPMDPGSLADQIAVRKPVSTRPLETSEPLSPEDSGSLQSQVEEESIGGLVTGDLLEDAKFYQDVAVELQTAYDTLQKRFDQQSCLMEEASGTLRAAESQVSQR